MSLKGNGNRGMENGKKGEMRVGSWRCARNADLWYKGITSDYYIFGKPFSADWGRGIIILKVGSRLLVLLYPLSYNVGEGAAVHTFGEHSHEVEMRGVSVAIALFGLTGVIFIGISSLIGGKFFMVFSPIFMMYLHLHPVCSESSSSPSSSVSTSSCSTWVSSVPSWVAASSTYSKFLAS